ncbi:hypothetical protein [Pseudoxanthomonas mexicana]
MAALGLLILSYGQQLDGKVVRELMQELIRPAPLAILLAYITITRPASALITRIMNPWFVQLDPGMGASLTNAGTAIGYLERTLIVSLVLVNQWEAIGFLLAAKGILRFNDVAKTDHRPSSEYVILGTLLSFLIAIGVGYAARHSFSSDRNDLNHGRQIQLPQLGKS